MPNEQKKPDDGSIYEEFGKAVRSELNSLGADLKDGAQEVKDNANAVIDEALRLTHGALGIAKAGYIAVEEKFGRDRLWGAGIGAKAGAVFSATKPHAIIPLYIAQIGIGTVVGGVIGLALGPQIARRYKQANGLENETNDNIPPPPAPPAP